MTLRRDIRLTDEQLKEDFKAWLDEFNIDLEAPILPDLHRRLLAKHGIQIDAPSDRYSRFRSEVFSVNEKGQTIHIADMENLNLEQLQQLLSFYQIPANKYIIGKGFTISIDMFMKQILPEMKAILADIVQHSPQDLVRYQIESRNRLSESALRRITNAIEPFIKECKVTVVEEDSALDKLYGLMGQLSSVAYALLSQHSSYSGDEKVTPERFSEYVLKFNALEKRVRKLCWPMSEIGQKHKHEWNNLFILQSALDDYAKFNRNKALLAAMNLQPSLNKFLEPLGIHVGYCDIFEHTLLMLAGVKTVPTKCKFDKRYYDPSRITFKLEGLKPAEGEQFIKWFRAQGDVTAGYDKDDQFKIYHLRGGGGESAGPAPDPGYVCEFDVDGEYLYDHILPLVKASLLAQAAEHPEWFVEYQDKSVAYFGKQLAELMKLGLEELGNPSGTVLSAEAAEMKQKLEDCMQNVIASIACCEAKKVEKELEAFKQALTEAVNNPEMQAWLKSQSTWLVKFSEENPGIVRQEDEFSSDEVEEITKAVEQALAEESAPAPVRMRESQEEKTRKLMQLKELDKEGVTRQEVVAEKAGKTLYRLFATSNRGRREELCEVSSREELEAKFAEYQEKFGAHEEESLRDTFTTDEGNQHFTRKAVGGMKDGQEVNLLYTEMIRGNRGYSA